MLCCCGLSTAAFCKHRWPHGSEMLWPGPQLGGGVPAVSRLWAPLHSHHYIRVKELSLQGRALTPDPLALQRAHHFRNNLASSSIWPQAREPEHLGAHECFQPCYSEHPRRGVQQTQPQTGRHCRWHCYTWARKEANDQERRQT